MKFPFSILSLALAMTLGSSAFAQSFEYRVPITSLVTTNAPDTGGAGSGGAGSGSEQEPSAPVADPIDSGSAGSGGSGTAPPGYTYYGGSGYGTIAPPVDTGEVVLMRDMGEDAATTKDFELSRQSAQFGSTPIGTLSPYLKLTLAFRGLLDTKLSNFRLVGSGARNFSFTENCGTSSFRGYSYCTVYLYYSPVGVGIADAEFVFNSNVPGKETVVIPVSGVGINSAAGPIAEWATTLVDFGNWDVSTGTISRSVYLKNVGGSTGDFSNIPLPPVLWDAYGPWEGTYGPSVSASGCGAVPAGGQCLVTFSYDEYFEEIRALAPAGVPSKNSLMLVSSGYPAPFLLSTSSLEFNNRGTQADRVKSINIQLHPDFSFRIYGPPPNYQDVDNHFARNVKVTVTGPFSVVHACGSVVYSGSSCPATVSYVPMSTGVQMGTLKITAEDGSVQATTVMLLGRNDSTPGGVAGQ